MQRKSFIALMAILALVIAACGGGTDETTTTAAGGDDTTTTVAETTTTEDAGPEVGSEENPIQVLFVPSVSAEEIIAGGELLEQTLETETGYAFDVSVGASYSAVLEEMCANPEKVVGFIPAQAYVLGSDLCGIDVALKSLRFGYTEYWTEFIVPRDSDIESLEDLNGKTWAYPEATSTSGWLVPSGIFATTGIEPGSEVEAGGHTATVLAIYNGEADFGTVFFSPAIDAEGNVVWDGTDEGADVSEDLVSSCGVNADGDLFCGDNYEVRDARRNIREDNPDVIQNVRILALSAPIPNDTMSFSPDFDEMLRESIVQALKDFAENDPDGFGTAFDAYSWSGVADTSDSDFDSIRALVDALGLSPEDLG